MNLACKLNSVSPCIFIMRRHIPAPEPSSILSRASIATLPRKSFLLERTYSTNHRSLATGQASELRGEKMDPLIKFRFKKKDYPNCSGIL